MDSLAPQLRIEIPAFKERGIREARTLLLKKGQLSTKSRSKHRRPATAQRGVSQDLLSVATAQSVVSRSDHSIVYRATLDNDTVIIKCSVPSPFRIHDHTSFNDLKAEAHAYQKRLKTLHGTVVPNFHGFFHGTCLVGRIGEKPIGCLVLEDCGESVEKFFYELSFDDRAEIARLLAKLHHAGCIPDDFAEQNLVCRDGQYRLIDFHGLKPHKCEWPGNLYVGEREPEVDDMGCIDLYMNCKELSIWTIDIYPDVKIAGSKYSSKRYPSQEDIDFFFPKEDYNVSDLLINLRTILTWLENYRKSTLSREEYKASMPPLNIIFGTDGDSDS
ncbi:hypothetical protein PLICRDRAFT_94488 [Plicaturopsis crispa FD-325 SS-3]|nr:hypothetical protein PLICRDRAFT_94488 [Plicaturopsis crispa FD-325 SS-3]